MFFNFAPKSNCCLNLEAWSQKRPLKIVDHDHFAEHTFFELNNQDGLFQMSTVDDYTIKKAMKNSLFFFF